MRGLRTVSSYLRRGGCLGPRLLSSQSSGGIVRCDLEDISVPELSWSQLCWSNLAKFSHNTALVDGVSGRSYSLGEAREAAGRLGSGATFTSSQSESTVRNVKYV